MRLQELIKMWRDDPQVESVTEVERESRGDFLHVLCHVLYRDRTAEYGRHAGLAIQVRQRDQQVIHHEVFNMTIDGAGNWVRALRAQFTTWINQVSTWDAGSTGLANATYYVTAGSGTYGSTSAGGYGGTTTSAAWS